MVKGETLDRIAATHYADPTRWRLIADANHVVDPLALSAGELLVIPEIPVRRTLSRQINAFTIKHDGC